MKDDRQEKLKISNDLLDVMLIGVETQEDLWGKDGIITQINKALLERILKGLSSKLCMDCFSYATLGNLSVYLT